MKLPQHKNIQIPVCITHTVSNRLDYCKYYQINTSPAGYLESEDLNIINKDVTEMFKELMTDISSRKDTRFNNRIIFAHNLGGFDGIFIHKQLVELYGNKTECLIDDSNKYIAITYNGQVIDTSLPENQDKIKNWSQIEHKQNSYKIEFKDSCRLFPVTLDQLCEVFGVKGKISKYNTEFNNINLFNDITQLKLFKLYAKQDTIALYNALTEARKIYAQDWDIVYTSVYHSFLLP